MQSWLTHIESIHPLAIELGLERVGKVARKLQVTEFDCPVITVAGTNGKGTCVAFLAEILQQAGYHVATYTSPHLLDFKERIQINGQPLAAADLLRAFAQVEQVREQTLLTYFEFTTLAALWVFKRIRFPELPPSLQDAGIQPTGTLKRPDAVILEVGLGGRLDAVNCVESDVAVITTIALDHQEWLGDTREAIGQEKAGIFRANKPAICGEVAPPGAIFAAAEAIGARLSCLNRDFSYMQDAATWSWRTADRHLHALPIPHLPLQNAATALMALHCLHDRLPVSTAAICQGLSKAFVPGRFQKCLVVPAGCRDPVDRDVKASRQIILDVAHNPAAAQYLANRLQAEPKLGKTLAVVSIFADKDIPNILAPLLPLVDEWYVAGLDDLPRGVPAASLAQHLSNLNVSHYTTHSTVLAAFTKAMSECEEQDSILVFGSFHTVAPVLAWLQRNC